MTTSASAMAPATRPPSTVPLLAGASAVCLVIALLAEPWSRLLGIVWDPDAPMLVSLRSSSWLLLLGLVGSLLRPGIVPVALGDTVARWRLVAIAAVGLAAATGLVVVVTGANAYSDAEPVFELVLVPITEELVFRGLVLGALLLALRRIRPEPVATRLAIVYSAVAFGLAHATNALHVDPYFVVGQVAFAALLGVVLARVRVRTDSVIPAVVLHTLVNGVNLLA